MMKFINEIYSPTRVEVGVPGQTTATNGEFFIRDFIQDLRMSSISVEATRESLIQREFGFQISVSPVF
jgi:hypothetical protein